MTPGYSKSAQSGLKVTTRKGLNIVCALYHMSPAKQNVREEPEEKWTFTLTLFVNRDPQEGSIIIMMMIIIIIRHRGWELRYFKV